MTEDIVGPGAVYIYQNFDNTLWSDLVEINQDIKLECPNNCRNNARFGRALSVSDDGILVVGAPLDWGDNTQTEYRVIGRLLGRYLLFSHLPVVGKHLVNMNA